MHSFYLPISYTRSERTFRVVKIPRAHGTCPFQAPGIFDATVYGFCLPHNSGPLIKHVNHRFALLFIRASEGESIDSQVNRIQVDTNTSTRNLYLHAGLTLSI